MKLLLATDGSAGASVAADLVAGLVWPADTTVDVVYVVDTLLSTWAYAPVPDLQITHAQLTAEGRVTIDRTVTHLRSRGLGATGSLILGPEIPSLLDHATMNGTDLIVCGSRGRGHLRSLILGSVSAGVVARAPCSVLVARHPTITRVVAAIDGSPSATAVERLVVSLPMFAHLPLDLVTVAGPSVGPEHEWHTHLQMLARWQHSIADRLREGGRPSRETLVPGRPASEIVDQARGSGADLIVLGAHRQTSLDKALLGSTTLEVLTHSSASVLVARQPVLRSADITGIMPDRPGLEQPVGPFAPV